MTYSEEPVKESYWCILLMRTHVEGKSINTILDGGIHDASRSDLDTLQIPHTEPDNFRCCRYVGIFYERKPRFVVVEVYGGKHIRCTHLTKYCTEQHILGGGHREDQSNFPRNLFEEDAIQ